MAEMFSRSSLLSVWSGHRHEPYVDVEADLVAGVVGRQRPAARLRHVADQDALPAGRLGGLRRESLQERDQFRMTPIAVARQPHHLPGRAVDRQFDAALQTAARVVADGHGFAEARQLFFREQDLGRQFFFCGRGLCRRHRRGDGRFRRLWRLRAAAAGESAGKGERQGERGGDSDSHDGSDLAILPSTVRLNAGK